MSYWFSKLQFILKKASGSALLNNKYFTNFILPLLFVIIVTIIYGSVYYEENDDFFLSLLLKGDLQPQGGFREIAYWGYRYLLYGYSFLYAQLPSIPWYGLVLYILNAAASINIFFIIERSLYKHFTKLTSITFSLVILFTVNIENIILINFTRTAILLAGSSIVVLIILLTENKPSVLKAYIILYSLSFSLAFFIRPIAVLMISLLMLPFIIYTGLRSNKKKLTYYFTSLFLVICSLFYIVSNSFKPDFEKEIIKYYSPIANIMDFGSENPGALMNKQDSIKREAIGYFFITDKTQITDDYLSKISSSNYFSSDKLIMPKLGASVRHILFYLFKDYPGISFLYLLLLITLFYSGYRTQKAMFIFPVITLLAFLTFLLSINTLTKLPERLFVPLYSMFFVSNIYLLHFTEIRMNIKKNTKLTAVFLILASSFAIYSFSGNYKGVSSQSEENYETFSVLGNQYSSTTFLITLPSSMILGSLQPLEDLPLGSNKMLPIGGYTTIMPSYYKELESLCGSASINDFFNYMKNRPDYVLISNDGFNDFLARYFQTLYNNRIRFIPEEDTPDILKRRKLFLYKVTQ